jgi:pimeloyl-ACP methyl ester carboxylesterase
LPHRRISANKWAKSHDNLKELKAVPYANNQGVQIHYKVIGDGEPLLLVHGMFANWKLWPDYGYVDGLKDDYRLIMVDVRGHGASDKPHDSRSYDERLLANDLVAVLDNLRINKAHYLGYSMGGWIGITAAKYASERFHSFIIGGWQPFQDRPGHQPNPVPTLKEKGIAGIVDWLEPDAQFTDDQRSEMLANDVEAIIAMVQNGRSDFRDMLPVMPMPCLLYCGDADVRLEGAKACVQEMPDATLVHLPGYDHLGAIFRGCEDVLPHITRFLANVRSA